VIAGGILLALAASNAMAVQRTVLIELFTNTSCPYCPPSENAMHNLQVQHPEGAFLEYHAWWPGPNDPFYLYNTPDNSGRIDYYNVSGTPTMRADGKFPVSEGTLATMYNNRYNDPAPISLELSGDYDESTRGGFVKVTMTAQEALVADSYRLRVAITETDIYYNTIYNDNHYNIMRDMLPDHQGTVVTLANGVPEEYLFNFTLPTGVPPNSGIVEANARVVAFIQPYSFGVPNNGEVQQAAWAWITDLVSTGADPAPARFALEAGYPNPFNPVTTLPVRVEKDGFARLEILTADGRRVTVLHDGPLGAGAHEFQWNGTDGAGSAVASGVYLARLTGQTEQHWQRLVLLK
jgi:hypothetical protein